MNTNAVFECFSQSPRSRVNRSFRKQKVLRAILLLRKVRFFDHDVSQPLHHEVLGLME